MKFAPDKTSAMVISKKKKPFDISGIVLKGEVVDIVTEMKLVGFAFDQKMTMEAMVNKASKKGRAKIAALFRLSSYLSESNMETLYKAYVRSAMEYGCLEYMIAAPTHLAKLDRVQVVTEKLGGFSVKPLCERRDASLIGLMFKLLDGDGRGQLHDFAPTVVNLQPAHQGRHTQTGLQLVEMSNSKSLSTFNRSILGRAPKVWSKLPQHLITQGLENGWQTVTKKCQRFLTGKGV